MDWLDSIASLILALSSAHTSWVGYRRYCDDRTSRQPPMSSPAPPSVPTQSQLGQEEFLSSKVAKRSVLLVSTALGLVLIGNAVVYHQLPSFIFGNGIILSSSILVLTRSRRVQLRDNQGVVRENRFKWSFVVVCCGWFVWLLPKNRDDLEGSCCWDWIRLSVDRPEPPDYDYFFEGSHLGYWVGLMVYLTYIYIECW